MTPAAPTPQKRRFGLAPLAAGIAALLNHRGRHVVVRQCQPTRVRRLERASPLAAQRLSIVVLPFANLSGDPAQDYLVDALTDELTTVWRASATPSSSRATRP